MDNVLHSCTIYYAIQMSTIQSVSTRSNAFGVTEKRDGGLHTIPRLKLTSSAIG